MSLQRTLRRLSTRTIPAPTTAVSGTDNPRALRRRTIRNAAALAARSMAKVFVAPGIQDATRTVRSLIEDLKAPRANDAAIREALARAEEMLGDIQTAGETTDSLCVADINSPAARFRWQLQESSDFLQSWTQRLKTLQRPSYLTKLANQDETSQQLAEYNRRSADHLGRLMVWHSEVMALYDHKKAIHAMLPSHEQFSESQAHKLKQPKTWQMMGVAELPYESMCCI